MPLAEVEPKLDDRTFDEIYRDLRLRIPLYTKEWTNFNESDPGITLLQLFAWLSEMMLSRMNQIPRKNYLKFLQLLGQELHPAKPALAHLTFFAKGKKIETVPKGFQVSASLPDGSPPLIFETQQPLDPISVPLAVVGVSDGGVIANVTTANDTPGTKFRPFGWFASVDSALYLGFSQLADPDPKAQFDPFPDEMVFRVFLPADTTAGEPQKAGASPAIPPVNLIWEFRERDGADWERLNVFQDETAAFTRDGYIKVEGPPGIQPSKPDDPRLGAELRYWVRVRIEGGSYPEGQSPEIDFIRTNTVPAENLTTVRGQILGESQGQPNETYGLPFRPVQLEPLSINSEQNGHTEKWERVDDFLHSGRERHHFVLNATEGTIKFGDGERGRIPPAGALIIADEFRYGGGTRGNRAGAGEIKNQQSILDGLDKIRNERPAAGGSDEQTLPEILRDAPSIIKRRERAVTAEDFKQYALEVGGVKNAIALTNAHPDFPGVEVPGAVTVVIVPDSGDKPPKPSSELITAVCAVLEEHRLITTEVYVRGPEYHEVRVEAFVQAKPNASFDSVSRNVNKALEKFLDPKTWKFGEDLFPTEIYKEVLDADPDLVAVRNLNLYIDGRPHEGLDQVPLLNGELVFGRNHLVVVTEAQDR